MRRAGSVAALALALVAGVAGASSSRTPAPPRFRTVALLVDSPAPLAAWQLELVAAGDARIVGVEGGDAAPFEGPPAYDPAALSRGRIVLAAFATRAALPPGRHRVAVVHLRESGAEPRYEVRLIAAGDPRGDRIAATATISEGSSKP